MGNLSIQYHDIALGALEGSTPSVTHANILSNLNYFPEQIMKDSGFATFEPNNWVLDGSKPIFKSNPAFISDFLSDDAGHFSYTAGKRPELTFSFNDTYLVTGVTLDFGDYFEDICTKVSISWYKKMGESPIAKTDFYPDSTLYFCKWDNPIPVEGLKIKFVETGFPYRYAKLRSVAFGSINKFDMSKIRTADLQVEGDLISNKLSTSTLSWTLDSIYASDLTFRNKQPVYVYDDNNLLSVTYLKTAEQVGENIYNIKNEDLIGVLEGVPYTANKFTNALARIEISNILRYDPKLKGIQAIIDPSLSDMRLNGYIKNCSRREALRQICFSMLACATTFRTSGLRIANEFGARPLIIPRLDLDDIFRGQKLTDKDIVSEVIVYSHELVPDTNGNIEIEGIKYKDVKTPHSRKNPDEQASQLGKVFKVEDMTLVNSLNVDKILKTLYNYLMFRGTMSAKVVLGDRDIGEMVDIPLAWDNEKNTTGIISSMSIKLSNLSVADIESEVVS